MSRLQSSSPVPAERTRPAAGNAAATSAGRDSAASAAVLDAPPGSALARLAGRFGDRSPILLLCLTTLAGYALLVAVAIGAGFLLVDVLLPVHAVGHSVSVGYFSHDAEA